MRSSVRWSSRAPAWLLLVLVFAVEFFLFDHFGSRRVTGIYPRWNDQIQYLSECYTGHEYARIHGLPAGIWHALVNPSAQGTLHDVAAVIEFRFTGPSRSAALALGMLGLITWQAALFLATLRRTGATVLACAVAMLPLVLRGPWENVPGSAYDFRLDHFAMCALGITAAAALLTERFHHRGWSVVFGVATGITLLTRFITGTYFVVIFVALLAWVAWTPNRRQRLGHVMGAALIAGAMALPLFWLNREWVWNYYYLGHYVGPESAIRNQNFGLLRSLQYVFGWLGERHLGPFFGWYAIGVAITLAGVAAWSRRSARPQDDVGATSGTEASGKNAARSAGGHAAPAFMREAAVLGLIFLLSPALVLTLHPQKSEVVLGALAPGVVLLVVWAWTFAWRPFARPRDSATMPRIRPAAARNQADAGRWSSVLVRQGLAAVIVLVAIGSFWHRQTVTFESPEAMANFRQVNGLADYVVTKADAARLPVVRVAVDYITDALDAQVLRVVCYERHHVWKDWDMKLPTGIAEPDAATVRQRLAESDFVFLTLDDTPPRFPYDRKLRDLHPEMSGWCRAHLQPAKQFNLSGRSLQLYQRPEIPFP